MKCAKEAKRKCAPAESPYLLKNQKLNKNIFIKAVDKNGNERVAVLLPQKPLPWYEKLLDYWYNYIRYNCRISLGENFMAKIYKIILLSLFLGLFSFGAEAAILNFSPSSGEYAVGGVFSVSVFVSSADQAMNAASGAVSFPADKLEVVSF